MLVIKNGRLVDAKNDFYADILIDNEKIIAIGEDLTADETIDAAGKIVMPAFVDTHVHFRDPGFTQKEDLETGAHSALRGGYGSVNLMANTNPVVDTPEVYNDIMQRAKDLDLVNMSQCYAVSKDLAGEEWVDFDTIPSSIKFLSDDGHGLHRTDQTYRLFKELAARDLKVMIHEEDNEISPVDYRIAEDVDTIRDTYLSGKTGARIHFCHVSTIDSMRAVQFGKSQGYPVSAEVTPHHIYMADSDFRVNPPIRTQADVDYLVQAIINGDVDAIATDHAPHTAEEKAAGSPGLIGLETAFQIVYKVLVEQHQQSLSLVSQMMSYGPAQVLDYHKGLLSIGYDADIVIVDLDKQETIKEENIASRSHNTPFLGETFTGQIEKTIVNGHIKYDRLEEENNGIKD